MSGLLVALLLIAQSAISPGRGNGALAASGGGGPTLVQECTTPSGSIGAGGTLTCTFGSAPAAGHFIVCGDKYTGTSTMTFSGDAAGYTRITSNPFNWNSTSYSELWYAWNTTGGTTAQVLHSGSATTFSYLNCQEWSGVQTSSTPFDVSDPGRTSTGTSITGNAVTTTANGDLCIGWINTAGSPTAASSGSGWTQGARNGAIIGIFLQSQVQTTVGSITSTGTVTPSETYMSSIACFKHL